MKLSLHRRMGYVGAFIASQALLAACSGSDGSPIGSTGGGSTASGGSSVGGAASGGVTARGGSATGGLMTGGASNGGTSLGGAGTGGTAPAGGSPNGGAPTTGGAVANGGVSISGGAPNTGGAVAIGGAAPAGGKAATGGTSSKGGAVATGGQPTSGGTNATGGTVATGGRSSTGGSATGGIATGGSATGGKASTGGASAGGQSCETPPAADAVQGWAATSGMGTTTTTGGGNATPKVVTTLDEFKAAVSGTGAAVVYLNAKLAPAAVAVGSNKTIVGICGAEFHGHLGLSGSSNVIIRNLKIVGYGVGDCAKDPDFDSSVGCSSGEDAITVSKASHHIWFDHCDISDGTDGNLDINSGSDFITISWTKFHYTPRTDNVGSDATNAKGHRYSTLIGSGDNVAEDVGHLNVTFHHDWWADNVDQRMPRTRRGKIHVVNCLYTSTGNSYCTNSGFETHVLVENNIYIGVKNPLSPDANGDMLARNNVYTNTTGTTTANGTGFTPPYTYSPEATSGLEAAIRSGAGPH